MIARAAPSISAMRPQTRRDRSQPVASAERGDRGQRPEQRAAERAVEGGARGDVAADQQQLAAGQAAARAPRSRSAASRSVR